MFHKRLVLLWCVALGVTFILTAQMTILAVGQGATRRAAAEKRLDLVSYLPTCRGRILDRQGRELAVDRPCYDVAVDYEVITGAWALKQAAREARKTHREAWASMSPQERDAAIEELLPRHQDRVERLWGAIIRHGGIDRTELDRRLDAIKQEVQTTAAVVWDRQLREEIKFDRDGNGEGFRPRPIREQQQAHVILPRVPDEVAFAFRRLAVEADLPGIHTQDSHRRAYPWSTAEVTIERATMPRDLRTSQPLTVRVSGVADHMLGSMRDEVWAADRERRPFRDPITGDIDPGGYRSGDVVGNRGLERVFEDHLRGLRGIVHKRLDTGRVQRDPAVPGRDLHLTIDIALQAQVQALLSHDAGLTVVHQWQVGWDGNGHPRPSEIPLGTPLDGAAVVIEVATGEILAMVSMPTIAMGLDLPEACRDASQMWINRPVEAVYPPGSIAKPLVLTAADAEGLHGLDEPIECTGHYLPDRNDIVRCWIYRPPAFATHGPVLVEEALARSCNIYFYTLGDLLGMDRICAWYRRFGVGRPFDVGLLHEVRRRDGSSIWIGENGGSVPSRESIAKLGVSGELRFASVIMGIGQGPVTWTPVHAANTYATLARRGRFRDPTLIAPGVSSGPSRPAHPRPNLDLDEEFVSRVLEGLRQSVSEPHGTGQHIKYADGTTEPIIDAPDVVVWAKTGTAQAPPRTLDLDCDGTTDVELLDSSHAWFVGLVGPDGEEPEPTHAIAVVVEYGGSGGRTAGPIANQIIYALQAHGYLPRSRP